jgi:hypothetical protein
MPWSTYAAVLLQIPQADAERIATEHGASTLGPPTFQIWWEARIDAATALVLATLRANDYLPPDDPAELSTGDASLLSEAVAQQAVADSRKFMVRQGGGEKHPVPELGVRLRQILGGIVQLDIASTTPPPGAVFLPTATAARSAILSGGYPCDFSFDGWRWP